MAKYEISGPGGARYEVTAPDTMSEADVMARFQRELPSQQPPQQSWGEYARGLGREALQSATLDFADELGLTDRAASERFGAQYPIASTVARIAGGVAPFVAGPGAAVARLAVGRTLPRTIGRSAAVGAGAGALSGAGAGEGGVAERLPSAAEGAVLGAGFGAAVPSLLAGLGAVARGAGSVVSPATARLSGAMRGRGAPDEAFPPPASGRSPPVEGATFIDDAQRTVVGPGADAQADQILANDLLRSGRTIDEVRTILAQIDRSRTAGTGSQAASAVTLADVVPGWQRALGAAARASTEVGETADRFFAARQTGHTPAGGRPLHAGAGIPTREPMSPRLTGAQAERELGSSFGTPAKRLVSMGQRERVLDGMRRMFRIRDEAQHGHVPSAHQTLKAFEAEGKKASDKAYGAFRLAQHGYDIRPHIQPAIERIRARIADPETPPATARWLRFIDNNMHRDGQLMRTADAFDQAKRAIDAKINHPGTDNFARTVLRGELDALTESVDAITARGIGPRYQAARQVFFDNKRLQEAYQAGRNAAKEGAEVGADTYRALPGAEVGKGATYKKAYRLGVWEQFNARTARLKPTDDVTNIFKQGDLDLLEAVIPRTSTAVRGTPKGEFGDRPERFGRYLDTERRMVATQRATRGGSQTAERLRDDEARDVAHQVVEGLRNLGTMGFDIAARTLNRMFGYQADTAQAIATRLLSADPAVQDRALANIALRMGNNRFELFTRQLAEIQGRLSGGLAAAAPMAMQPQQGGPVSL
jgi:hypothetical protein